MNVEPDTSPIAVLREATKQYRPLRYAWAVLGLAAVAAIVRGFGLSGPATVYALIVLLALMGVMVVFESIADTTTPRFHKLAVILTWTTTLAFASVLLLL